MLIAQFAKAVFNLSAICKTKKCLFRSTRWRIVPLSICVICANCTICKSCFQFECNLQNEEMSFQIYLEYRCVICANCTICKSPIWVNLKKCLSDNLPLSKFVQIAHLQKLFSIWVQSAICKSCFQEMKKWLFRFTRWRIVPLSICVICANCTICKSCFQFECNLQNEEMSFQISVGGSYRYQFV